MGRGGRASPVAGTGGRASAVLFFCLLLCFGGFISRKDFSLFTSTRMNILRKFPSHISISDLDGNLLKKLTGTEGILLLNRGWRSM